MFFYDICTNCKVEYDNQFQWFCALCNWPRTNIPDMNDYDIHELVAINEIWAEANETTACCGLKPKDCICSVCISLENANSVVRDSAYNLFSDCSSCFHYRKFSCTDFKNYVREELSGEYPQEIKTCGDFIWNAPFDY